ncbi:choline-binding transcriptional repressor BetI [Indioceanicola profundi]|uniref:choline-binding transcriptional repressor BetI n=1 Tax=Indioceanicola profundi TaxID=2220096 RepID=UPI001CED1EA3|nr:transcriptional regulator BetI [Indioceanicola profundi]
MPKVGLQPIRRRQLISATIEAIHAYGYDETTMARIAARAGLSPGIITHYFGGKDELLEATMRSLLTDFQRLVVKGLQERTEPMDRISAIVSASFDETQCTPQVVAAWLAFWAQVPHHPGLARLQRTYRLRLHSNLRRELGRLGLPPESREELAELTGGLIDGIWMRSALSGTGLDTVRARRTVLGSLRLHLAALGVG